MQTSWIVVADSERARIFARHGRHASLEELDDFINPAGGLAERELSNDALGRFYGKGERFQAHTADPAVFPVEHQIELFAGRLADFLEQARLAHRFDHLRLIAAPRFLGVLRQKIRIDTARLVTEELPKDIVKLTAQEIAAYIDSHSELP